MMASKRIGSRLQNDIKVRLPRGRRRWEAEVNARVGGVGGCRRGCNGGCHRPKAGDRPSGRTRKRVAAVVPDLCSPNKASASPPPLLSFPPFPLSLPSKQPISISYPSTLSPLHRYLGHQATLLLPSIPPRQVFTRPAGFNQQTPPFV